MRATSPGKRQEPWSCRDKSTDEPASTLTPYSPPISATSGAGNLRWMYRYPLQSIGQDEEVTSEWFLSSLSRSSTPVSTIASVGSDRRQRLQQEAGDRDRRVTKKSYTAVRGWVSTQRQAHPRDFCHCQGSLLMFSTSPVAHTTINDSLNSPSCSEAMCVVAISCDVLRGLLFTIPVLR